MSQSTKKNYSCTECGAVHNKWAGQCGDCTAWNTLTEVALVVNKNSTPRFKSYTGIESSILDLDAVPLTPETRISTHFSELDRVLGGGLVEGSVVLVGGDPGIGKSTILLQTLSYLSENKSTLYVTGEESLQQIKIRSHRLGLEKYPLRVLAQTQVETILSLAQKEKPDVMVIDSIQTLFTELIQSAPGSVSQVRESAAQLVRFAKQTGVILFLVGHVTKEGTLAGPRVLEHMVDTVLYFEGQKDSRFRVIRAVKNRFGAVNELGVFSMEDKGLKGVNNPSAIFLSQLGQALPGSSVMVSWEGSRPLLVEVQALVDESHLGNPRRVTLGLEQNRLALILAVLNRHSGVLTYNQDVFVNIVGGMRVTETGSDLPMSLAIFSSLKNKVLPRDLVAFGEIGLSGEIRPVQSGQERLKEAYKQGFKQALVPKGNLPKKPIDGIQVIGVSRVEEALDFLGA